MKLRVPQRRPLPSRAESVCRVGQLSPEAGRIGAGLLAPIVRYLRELGLEAGALFREVGLPLEATSELDVRVSSDGLSDLLTRAADRCGDPAFGLHAGQRLRPGDIGLLEYVVRTSGSLEEIAQQLIRYHELAGNVAPRVDRRMDAVVCELPLPVPHPAVLAEYNLSLWARLARAIRGEDLRPLEVRFTHGPPAHADEAERVLGAPARFRCERDELVFAREGPASFAPVDRGLRRAVADRADEALAAIGDHRSVADRVRVQLGRRIGSGGVTVDSIAKSLGMSARTLRRRLAGEGTHFEELRDAVRRERALVHMAEPGLALSEVAYRLGFSGSSAFHRAFRRWTGKTPAQYRQDGLRGPSAP